MTRRFKMSDLKYEAAQVKRHMLNEVRRGRLKKVSKKNTLDLIAARPRVNLKSSRTLWDGDVGLYLDEWYNKLNIEIDMIQKTINSQSDVSGLTDEYIG